MRFTLLLFLLFCTLCSCSTHRENTYEENLAICTKKLSHFPEGIDTLGIEGRNAELQFEEQIRECMKGSIGPAFVVKTYRGDSVSTSPRQGKAVVLFFWSATLDDAPAYSKKSDLAVFAAMNGLHRKYSQNVDFLGFPFNDSATTRRHLQAHPLNFPQADDSKLSSNKHITLTQNTTPYVIFINTQGRVIKIMSGGLATEKRITEVYSPIIKACIENKPYSE
ncbi:peroxiredoxin family protein [Hymenobacter sp. HD11105]